MRLIRRVGSEVFFGQDLQDYRITGLTGFFWRWGHAEAGRFWGGAEGVIEVRQGRWGA
jgi:hypothetical protein